INAQKRDEHTWMSSHLSREAQQTDGQAHGRAFRFNYDGTRRAGPQSYSSEGCQ
ncbi:hypothetical protein EVAR_64929_1, partial [Eumeta japonica]